MKENGIGLLLIGHGASQGGGGPVRRLAGRLRASGRFDQVEACFWKERPFVAEAFTLIATKTVLAVPVFATEGRIAKELIPAQLGLTDAVTDLKDGRRVHYLHAVGVHPGLAKLADERARRAAGTAGIDPKVSALMLIAHGNKRGGTARASAETLAARIRDAGGWSEVKVLFLEEEPRAAAWTEHLRAASVVALPLLLAEGQHAAHDVAPLFGQTSLAGSDLLVLEHAGRRVAYTRGLGDDEALARLILEMALSELNLPSPR